MPTGRPERTPRKAVERTPRKAAVPRGGASARAARSSSGAASSPARSGGGPARPDARTGTGGGGSKVRPAVPRRSARRRSTSGEAEAARGGSPAAHTSPSSRSVRIGILAGMLVLLAVTLVPTLRSYLSQQNDIAAMRTTIATSEASVAELQKEQARWADPAFVQQQARERLKFVKPGDKLYTVLGAGPASAAPGEPPTAGLARAPSPTATWYGKVWASLVLADSRATTSSR